MSNTFQRLGKYRFQQRVEALRTVGNAGNVGKVIRSKKDRENDPRIQRKTKRWLSDD